MAASDWNVEVDPLYGCWLYQGRTDKDGYPIEWRGNKPVKVYRLIYEAETGTKVPEDMVLDHGCAVRSCCAPHHLEPVSQSENLRRRNWRYKVRRKVCQFGHTMADAMVLATGGRVCRTCAREATRGAGD